MAWRIELAETAEKQLAKLDRQSQVRIWRFLRERVLPSVDPHDLADPLQGNLSGLWKYRVGDYRIVVEFREEEVLVLVVRIGHRSKIYGGH